MASLDRNLRRDLENAVKKARRVAEAGARAGGHQLAVGHHEPWSALSPDQRKLRNRLRAHGRQLGDKLDEKKGTQSIDRLTGECAYEHWHRLLFARFLAENDLLVEPESGMALSLDECRELAREQSKDWLVLASDFAQRMLPQIFRAGDPVLEVALPPEKRQELEAILEGLPREVFIADDSLGWVYQFWQADQKDAVNASENKIGADELPAVTQLFTEDYMVLFLLHNTLGAWWAGKVLAAKPDLARAAASEDELRAACAVQGIEWSYLRFVREGDVWRPAAGTFPGWPTAAKDLTVLDPCMGSGHFLAFALPMLVALRRAEEKLSVAESVDAVLGDNLFGLEIDPRCTQIAAFNVGLTAWKLAGYRPLPALNLACAGLSPSAKREDWVQIANGDLRLRNGMERLHGLFAQGPVLGSLIDPRANQATLLEAGFDHLEPLLERALTRESTDDGLEIAVTAFGIAKAARLLAGQYTFVVTNVPYLLRRKHGKVLLDFCQAEYPDGRNDLATVFLERLTKFVPLGQGTIAAVVPQNALLLGSYKKLRVRLLKSCRWNLVAGLGAGAFETIGGEVVNVCLVALDRASPDDDDAFAAFDAVDADNATAKAASLRAQESQLLSQASQLRNPDARIITQLTQQLRLLSSYADSYQGIVTGDDPQLRREHWELVAPFLGWKRLQSTCERPQAFGGREGLVRWRDDGQELARRQGVAAWGKQGVSVRQMGSLAATLFSGDVFDVNAAAIIPREPGDLAAIWAFCSSPSFEQEVRKIDRSIKVTNATLVKVPFDIDEWRQVASRDFPNGIPTPSSADPTQWLFRGNVCNSVSPLQVAVARLVGVSWPEQVQDFPATLVDNDGIVCLPPLRGESSAADRVQAILAASFAKEWSVDKLNGLLASVGFERRTLDEWLRDGFAAQHCETFGQLPFVWQVWDGLKGGFSALVNYHRLAEAKGEGRRVLEKLTHTYLGDWLDRQRAEQKAGVEGADGRVAAAEHLKRELEKILEGEPPYDIFVRWKPMHQQPIGWEPDIDDGVRVNIRPFMTAKPLNARGKNACILRVAPKIKWDKDRGKEPYRLREDYPWFWNWDGETSDFTGGKDFDGNRHNDLHYSNAMKMRARDAVNAGKNT
jgi:hypothetical protein